MGYQLHVTRSVNWSDGDRMIGREEWRRFVDSDRDLKLYDATEVDELDPVYRLEIPDLDNAFCYNELAGTIDVARGYFEDVLWKVLEIAARLGAVVQGDEGEYYRLSGLVKETTFERPDITSWPAS